MKLTDQYDQAYQRVLLTKAGDLLVIDADVFAVVQIGGPDDSGNRACVLLTPGQSLARYSLCLTDVVLSLIKLLPS